MEGTPRPPQDMEVVRRQVQEWVFAHRLPPPPQSLQGTLAMLAEEAAQRAKSALETEVVLEHLFRFLNVADLRSARQVCSLWNEEAVFYLRKRSRAIKFLEPGRGDKFLACAQSSADFPFTKLTISPDWPEFSSDTDTESEVVQGAAPWLTSLRFGYKSLTFHLAPGTTFPQLTALHFSTSGSQPVDMALPLQVLDNAPGLTTLGFWDSGENSFLPHLCRLKRPPQLQRFSIYSDFQRKEINFQEYWRPLLLFLESQRLSLRSLNLSFVGGRDARGVPSPTLIFPHVEKLRLFWRGWGGILFQDSLQYARVFPKLRSLCSSDHTFYYPSPIIKPSFMVTHLSLDDRTSLQQPFLENAPKLFPNVAKLEILDEPENGEDWKVGELVSAFPNLQHLRVTVAEATGLARVLNGGRRVDCRKLALLTGEPLREREAEWRRRISEGEEMTPWERLRVFKVMFAREDQYRYELEMEEMDMEEIDYYWEDEWKVEESLPESLCVLLRLLMPNLEVLHLTREMDYMNVPRPLTQWMAEIERNTTILFDCHP